MTHTAITLDVNQMMSCFLVDTAVVARGGVKLQVRHSVVDLLWAALGYLFVCVCVLWGCGTAVREQRGSDL